jgi:hypothetical protein
VPHWAWWILLPCHAPRSLPRSSVSWTWQLCHHAPSDPPPPPPQTHPPLPPPTHPPCPTTTTWALLLRMRHRHHHRRYLSTTDNLLARQSRTRRGYRRCSPPNHLHNTRPYGGKRFKHSGCVRLYTTKGERNQTFSVTRSQLNALNKGVQLARLRASIHSPPRLRTDLATSTRPGARSPS